MRKLWAGIFKFISYCLNAAMIIHIILQWMQGANWLTLLAIFALYFVPMMGALEASQRLREPKQPRKRRQKAEQAAPAPKALKPLPAAPQRPVERRIANPPTIGQVKPALAPQSASMSPELRQFVEDGEKEITTPTP